MGSGKVSSRKRESQGSRRVAFGKTFVGVYQAHGARPFTERDDAGRGKRDRVGTCRRFLWIQTLVGSTPGDVLWRYDVGGVVQRRSNARRASLRILWQTGLDAARLYVGARHGSRLRHLALPAIHPLGGRRTRPCFRTWPCYVERRRRSRLDSGTFERPLSPRVQSQHRLDDARLYR